MFYDTQFEGILCGIDEVGRGPLAGPVMAACVHIPPQHRDLPFWAEVKDSKKLSAKKREALYGQIIHYGRAGTGFACNDEIDQLNIHHATLLAMKRAYEDMCTKHDLRPDIALIDGKFIPATTPPCRCEALVKGDSLSLSIAAASIVAKVLRDRHMKELAAIFPAYGWDRNAGYGTAEHLAALQDHGVTSHHRRSFAPIRQAARAS